MAAKIKLKRIGARSKPYYRVVVQDESASPVSKVVAILGVYHPLKEPALFEVDKEKVLSWIKKGARPTERLRILLGKAGILSPIDLAALPRKKAKGKAAAETPAEGGVPAETPVTEEVKT